MSVMDTLLIPIIVFVVFIGAIFGAMLLTEFNNTGLVTVSFPNFASIFDYGIIFLGIGFLIAAIISAFYIDTHPIFFIISAIMLIIIMLAVPVLTNSFMGVVQDPSIVTYTNQFPVTLQFLGNMPIIVMVGGFLVIIALYVGKNASGGRA